MLPCPPYSSDLAPSDFHLLGPLKDAARRTQFESYDDLVSAVRIWMRQQNEERYRSGVHALVLCRRKAVELRGEFVENNGI